MFPVKSEPSDTLDVGKDSQRISLMDDTLYINGASDINTSDNRPDKNHSEEMLLTVAYVKNESMSNTLDFNSSNCKGNKGIHEKHEVDMSAIKPEKKGACNDNTSGDITEKECSDNTSGDRTEEECSDNTSGDITEEACSDNTSGDSTEEVCSGNTSGDITEEHKTMQMEEESEDCHVKEHDSNHVTDISIHGGIGYSAEIDMGELCLSKTSQSRYETHKYVQEKVHSGEKRVKCDVCAYSTKTPGHLKTHQLIHSGEKPYKCDVCDYSTTQSGTLKTHKLIHSGEKPYKV